MAALSERQEMSLWAESQLEVSMSAVKTQLNVKLNVKIFRKLTVFGARRHVQVNLLSAGADEAHQELLDGVGVVGGEGRPVGGVHAQLASPLTAL